MARPGTHDEDRSLSQTQRNREEQRQVYGEPLAETFHRLTQAFGLSQARLADVLGISAPMLSQLITAQRIKIGNPAVVHRTRALEGVAEGVRSGAIEPDRIAWHLAQVKGSTAAITRPDGDGAVTAVRGLLQAVASGQDLHDAADLLQLRHPALAEVLRVYGLGTESAAREHFHRYRAAIRPPT